MPALQKGCDDVFEMIKYLEGGYEADFLSSWRDILKVLLDKGYSNITNEQISQIQVLHLWQMHQ